MHDLLERARRDGTPLVDGETATFVWEGDEAPRLIADFNGFGFARGTALKQVVEGVWAHTVTLPRDAYIEYVFARDEDRLLDPLNRRSITNGVGGMHSHFGMPEYEETPLALERPGVSRGTVTQHTAENGFLVVGKHRTVRLYGPAAPGPWPLLVVFDGQDYLSRARLVHIVDNLIADGRIRPIALAFVDHGDQARFIEYCCNDATLGFLLRAVVPLARQHLDLIDPAHQPGAYGLLGTSMSGLMALFGGLRVPEVFGHVISQSGAFANLPGNRENLVIALVRALSRRPIKIWMDVGRYEGLLEPCRTMHGLLQQKGYDVEFREYNGGHNFTSWKNEVWRGLERIYGADSSD